MFNGISLLARNNKLPVRLTQTAGKYSAHFGPAGFVVNSDLQTIVGSAVTLLDTSPLHLSEMQVWQDQPA